MSRESRRAGTQRTLESREGDFRRTLIEALHECAGGVWGLFGRNEAAFGRLSRQSRERFLSKDALDVIEIGHEIEALRAELGLPPYELYQRFLQYRAERDANAPGERTLARRFLTELGEEKRE